MNRKPGRRQAIGGISQQAFQQIFDKTFTRHFNAAFEPVSMRIFHDLIKTQTEGLPDDLSSLELWQTDLITREPTEKEMIASRLSLLIEEEAYNVIFKSALFDFIDDPVRFLLFAKQGRSKSSS